MKSDGGALRFVPRSPLYSAFERPALDRQQRQPAKDVRGLPQRSGRGQVRHRAGARSDFDRGGSSSREVGPLDVLGIDPDDPGIHDPAQSAGLLEEADSPAAASDQRSESDADE